MEIQRKRSKKRDAILACVQSTDTHPSAEWVYQQLKPEIPDLSLATVYRNLSMFRQEGIIASLGTVNGLERFDGYTEPHVHFICQTCGCVQDVHAIQVPNDLKTQVETVVSGDVTACELSFRGQCHKCATC